MYVVCKHVQDERTALFFTLTFRTRQAVVGTSASCNRIANSIPMYADRLFCFEKIGVSSSVFHIEAASRVFFGSWWLHALCFFCGGSKPDCFHSRVSMLQGKIKRTLRLCYTLSLDLLPRGKQNVKIVIPSFQLS